MATIDDVYAYLTGPIVTSLNVIVDSVNSNPSIAGNGVIDVAIHTQDLASLMYGFMAGDFDHLSLFAFLSTTAPDGFTQSVAGLNFVYLALLGQAIADLPPDSVSPDSYIAKIWDAVHRTVSVPEE